jgi:hypothetical protein
LLLIYKRIITCLFLTVACCVGVCVTNAMEQEEPVAKRRKTEEQVTSGIEKKIEELISPLSSLAMEGKKVEEKTSTWASLPTELKAYIISFLASAKNEKEAIRNIKALSLTSKELYNLIHDPNIVNSLILEISNQFGKSPVDVAREFESPAAAEWLKD